MKNRTRFFQIRHINSRYRQKSSSLPPEIRSLSNSRDPNSKKNYNYKCIKLWSDFESKTDYLRVSPISEATSLAQSQKLQQPLPSFKTRIVVRSIPHAKAINPFGPAMIRAVCRRLSRSDSITGKWEHEDTPLSEIEEYVRAH